MADTVPREVSAHLKELVASTDDNWAKESDALERLEALWLEKERLFEDQIRLLGMSFVDVIPENDERGMILATYSGSLVSLGPGSSRNFWYSSIKIRSDVPDILNGENVRLSDEVRVGSAASFGGAPVKSTSAIYRIAVVPEHLSSDEQESRIREAMVYLTTTFVHINRKLTAVDDQGPGQFDKKSMIRYLAESNGLTQKAVRGVLDDYGVLLETGMLIGKTVALGQLGRLSLTRKPPRKARVGRNPSTGGEMTIPAKPAHMAPVFKFTSRVKERAENLPLDDESDVE